MRDFIVLEPEAETNHFSLNLLLLEYLLQQEETNKYTAPLPHTPRDYSNPASLFLLICVWIFAGALLHTNFYVSGYIMTCFLTFLEILLNWTSTESPLIRLKAVLTQVSCYLTIFISTSYRSLILHYEFCTHSVFSEREHQLPRTGELYYRCISSSWRKELSEICWLCEHPRIQSLPVA